MGTATVIAELLARGIEPLCSKGRLILRPRDRVTPDVLELARQYKKELLAALKEQDGDLSGISPAAGGDAGQWKAGLDLCSRARDVARECELLGKDLRTYLETQPDFIDRDCELTGERSAAKSLIRTCREYGVGLRLEPDGTLVVESNGKAWRSLVRAIEAHVDAVAQLIEARWDSNDA